MENQTPTAQGQKNTMTDPAPLLIIENIPNNFLADIDHRETALWLRSFPKDEKVRANMPEFLGLPWRMVVSEVSDHALIEELETKNIGSLTQKRGFIQIIDSDPSLIELPERCLPIYLLNGRQESMHSDFQSRFRRMAMLEALRRSGVRQLLILSGEQDPIPPEMKDLWSSGFRPFLTFATDSANAEELLRTWPKEGNPYHVPIVSLLNFPASNALDKILKHYADKYPEDRLVIRMRDQLGNVRKLDVTDLDDPERPILEYYSVIEERDLSMLTPDQITEQEFVAFFQNSETFWRPYAAGLPWPRDKKTSDELGDLLRKLDVSGPEETCIAYIVAEPGAGGTTISRMLAWEYANHGYPVLIAKPLPFVPNALSVANFLHKVHLQFDSSIDQEASHGDSESRTREWDTQGSETRRYETPWLVIFDRIHWQHRDTELRQFRNQLTKSGRPVCVLVISGPVRELAYYNTSVFKNVGELNHVVDQNQVRRLGVHLNRFLRLYNKDRATWQWDNFYNDHTIRSLEGVAAFWVALSFWIQGQYDLSESIQEWMYRSFREGIVDRAVQYAVLEIAAVSSERLPMPDGLLPVSQEEWPVSHLLEDARSTIGALGLITFKVAGKKYWALAHDVLGRFLITALFHDFPMREELGFANAKNADHLRFLLLRGVSQKSELGERIYRDFGDDFATSIFKIDPDHGHAHFALFWREVLETLDGMASPLRDNSRVFRHHTAISRRRIAKRDESIYGVTIDDKAELLNRAIEDIKYALHSLDRTPESEPNLNLYNSLAHAYFDLAGLENTRGANLEYVKNLRRLAKEATRQAYEESPASPFVIETYVRDLLESAQSDPESGIEYCIMALEILFSAISSNEESYRRAQLGAAADAALGILFQHAPELGQMPEPSNAIDVLTKTWIILADGVDYHSGSALSDLPESNRAHAIQELAHPAGRGNMQVIRLTYELICVTYPYDFDKQLEHLEQLQIGDYWTTPQMQLEYGLLLYQNNRFNEGDRVFRNLRRLWSNTDHFVTVPSPLRWLREQGGRKARIVNAAISSGHDTRAMALVREFQNLRVPFRSEEFSLKGSRPGTIFSAFISFGHNGPFLRPVTAKVT